jgi:hypothetical protein
MVDPKTDITVGVRKLVNPQMVQKLYKRSIDNVYNVTLSAVKKQDNFISI